MNFKQILKRFPQIFGLNAKIKAARIWGAYRKANEDYRRKAKRRGITYSEEAMLELVQRRLMQRGLSLKPLPKGKFRIFWVGAKYDQDSSGIIQGLQKFAEVILFESRPKKYEQIWPSGTNYKTAKKENSHRLLAQISESLKTGPIHTAIGQMWAHTIDPDALQKLREMGVVVVNISMDDRHAFRGKKINGKWSGTAGLISSIDLAWTTAKECCLWYMVEGCPAIYLPEASDPELFKPLPGPKLHDVSFVGANYGIRAEIVRAIEKAGVKVATFGQGWSNSIVPTERMPELFARSRIVLGVGTIGYCTDFYALKMRDFDGPMSGSLYLTHHNPDLEELFVIGKEIETYRTTQECVEKVHYYLAHPDKAEAIGKAGRARAEREHIWKLRFEKLLKTIGILE